MKRKVFNIKTIRKFRRLSQISSLAILFPFKIGKTEILIKIKVSESMKYKQIFNFYFRIQIDIQNDFSRRKII